MVIPVAIGPIAATPVANSDFRPLIVLGSGLGVGLRHDAKQTPAPLPPETVAAAPIPPEPKPSPRKAPPVNLAASGALFDAAIIVAQLPPPPPLPSAAVERARLGIPNWVPPESDLRLHDLTA